jgi:hypothetical protein
MLTNAFAWCSGIDCNSDWAYRQPLELNTEGILSSDITNEHAILVHVDSTNTDFWNNSELQNDINDVRFTDENNLIDLNYYFESINTDTNNLWAWVRVPEFDADVNTVINLYYGNSEAIDTQNKTGVYPSNYLATYNLSSLTDSTINGYDLTNTGSTITSNGKIGSAYLFDGTDNTKASSIMGTTALSTKTISFWIKTNSTTFSDYTNIVGFMDGASASNEGFGLQVFPTSPKEFRITTYGYTTGGALTDLTELGTTNWHQIMFTYDGTNAFGYLDGEFTGTETFTPNIMKNFLIGRTSKNIDAYIDEVKVLDYNISDNEILLLYNSENQTLLSFGTQEGNEVGIVADFNWTIDKPNTQILLYDTSTDQNVTINDWNWLVDGTTTLLNNANLQNPSFDATQNTDYNVCLDVGGLGDDSNIYTDSICRTISSGKWYQEFNLIFYDETDSDLNGVTYTISPSLDGDSGGTLSDNNLFIDLEPLTTPGTYIFNLSKTGYATKTLSFDLNRYEPIFYEFVFIESDIAEEVDFQVFTESANYASNIEFFVYDYSLNKYVDIQTTDYLGRFTTNLNGTSSDYNFFSADFNFGTTEWTINKPKDATTLIDIVGNWKYSITGASYSSETNIVADVQKLLLQNTANPYYIAITDVDENYVVSTFGLHSITGEDTKTLDPYLYLWADSDLKLIKLLDYTTNQPIGEAYGLELRLYTDSNGIIPIGTYINDSTGTYNIYMDSNAHYKLIIDDQSFELKPTLGVYYTYITRSIGINDDLNVPTVDGNFSIGNFPTIFLETRQFAFGCSVDEENCYESAMFAIIAIILLTIAFIATVPSTPMQQTIISAGLLCLFTAIAFIPLWLFGVTLVIIIAWGIFS